jgi:hypothetical protein
VDAPPGVKTYNFQSNGLEAPLELQEHKSGNGLQSSFQRKAYVFHRNENSLPNIVEQNAFFK